jgi:hypothetical protein
MILPFIEFVLASRSEAYFKLLDVDEATPAV